MGIITEIVRLAGTAGTCEDLQQACWAFHLKQTPPAIHHFPRTPPWVSQFPTFGTNADYIYIQYTHPEFC